MPVREDWKPPPIFEMYSIRELSEKLGLTKKYLCELEDGTFPINKRFIRNAVHFLGKSKDELFGEHALHV